jgi:hypothetical protein
MGAEWGESDAEQNPVSRNLQRSGGKKVSQRCQIFSGDIQTASKAV